MRSKGCYVNFYHWTLMIRIGILINWCHKGEIGWIATLSWLDGGRMKWIIASPQWQQKVCFLVSPNQRKSQNSKTLKHTQALYKTINLWIIQFLWNISNTVEFENFISALVVNFHLFHFTMYWDYFWSHPFQLVFLSKLSIVVQTIPS